MINDRLGHNLERVIKLKTQNGVEEIKVSSSRIQANAHVEYWLDNHHLMMYRDDRTPVLVYAEIEKRESFNEGFNRALELVKNGAIDINEVEIKHMNLNHSRLDSEMKMKAAGLKIGHVV